MGQKLCSTDGHKGHALVVYSRATGMSDCEECPELVTVKDLLASSDFNQWLCFGCSTVQEWHYQKKKKKKKTSSGMARKTL